MSRPTITTSDGSLFDPDNVRPEIIGYQIVHKLTGRILPGTTRNEVYTMAAAVRRMNQVASMYTIMHCPLDIWDYEPVVLYDFEEPVDCTYITDKDDHLFK